ncbi:MAG TPA: methyltransferase domain-containing protein [Pyrinomonadaceae bacterium]|jgi:S-adenosylmethionine-dependent methyltransferase
MIKSDERFEGEAGRYADYLRTAEGRLRLDISWAHLVEALREFGGGAKGRVLDVGGGTGALSLRLAAKGWYVNLVDSSQAMLALAREAASRESLPSRVAFEHADAAFVDKLYSPDSFDLVICHNLLEYVADPSAVLKAIGRVTRRGGLVSLVARNRAGEALRAALKLHDFPQAEHALRAETVRESLYGGPARLFDPPTLRTLAEEHGFDVVAERGVRVVADYLPPSLNATDEAYARLCSLEQKLGARADFAAVARYLQIIARRR